MKTKGLILGFFVLTKFYLQYLAINPIYELHRDEYLHIDLGSHLAWGYTTVPPVTGLISFLIIAFGKSVFWVKFFPALFGVLTLITVWKIVEELKGGVFALVLAATGVLCSALLRINTLYQPNSLEYLMWTLVFLFVLRYFNREESKWIWYTAAAFVIGFLNKYNIGFLLLGMAPAILLTGHWKILKEKRLYLALVAAMIVILPNLFWQYQNGFPVVGHMQTLAETQLVNVDRSGFLFDQLLFFFGSVLTLLVAFIGFIRYRPFIKFRFIVLTYIFVIALYFYFRAKSYYAIGLYPVLLAFGAVYFEQLLSAGWRKHLRPLVLAIPVLSMIAVFNITVPALSPAEIKEDPELFKELGLLRWEDGLDHELPQDFADMLGWSELGELVNKALEQIDSAEKHQVLIHCDNYGQAGAINFYSRNRPNEALTFNADYLYWYPLEAREIKHVVLVQVRWDDDPERKREREWFESVQLVGEIENPDAREKGTRVYLLKNAKTSINKILKQEIIKKMNSQ